MRGERLGFVVVESLLVLETLVCFVQLLARREESGEEEVAEGGIGPAT